ncbi:MAG TPA: SurA N-terminal domain-containing protein [Candidatus Saccharimonadales bacterium]|nr:SurA N-terminal domain-containing protein [Candidatus Saccharimonadales bacterium]
MLHLFRDRRRTKLIWILVAGGTIFTFLIGFNFLFGTGAGHDQPRASASLGSIYGRAIPRAEYDAEVSREAQAYTRNTNRGMDDASQALLKDRVWERMLYDQVLGEQAHRLGLTTTDREVLMAVESSPPQELLRNPALMTNGQFDLGKYQRALRSPDLADFELEQEQLQRSQLPVRKLWDIVGSLAWTPDGDVREAYGRSREKAQVLLVGFPTSANPVKPEEVTRPELEEYYRKHQSEFNRGAEASLVLAMVPKTPTALDQRNTLDNARSLYRDATEDTNFAAFASQVSDAQVGRTPDGQPGQLVARGQLPKELDAMVFGLQAGQISQPLLVQDVYHIVKYLGPSQDSTGVKRHIVDLQVAIKPGQETLKDAYDQLEAIREQARKTGLASAAARAGLKPLSTGWFTEDGAPPLLQQLPEVLSFALGSKKGAITQVVDKPSVLLLAQVQDRRPAGLRTVAEVEGELRTRVAQEKSVDRSEARARQFLSQVQAAGSLAEAAKRAGMAVVGPVEFTRTGPFPPQLRYETDVIGSAFGYPPGSVKVVRGQAAAFVMQVLNHVAFDMAKFQAEASSFRDQLAQQRRTDCWNAYVQELTKQAKIQDRRAEVGI